METEFVNEFTLQYSEYIGSCVSCEFFDVRIGAWDIDFWEVTKKIISLLTIFSVEFEKKIRNWNYFSSIDKME